MFGAFGLEIRKKIHASLNDAIFYNTKESTDAFYSNEKLVARYENEQRIAFYEKIIEEISLCIDFKNISSASDVSAGSGRLLQIIRHLYPEKKLVGFEFSDSALTLCRKNCPGIVFEKRNLYEMVEGSFDVIMCVDTLEHLEYPEKAIDNLLGILSGNGYLCLVVPNGRYDVFEGHIHYWSPESFKLFLEKLRCDIIHSKTWNEFGEQLVVVQRK